MVRELLKLAKNDSYKEMVLDTIKPLQEAIHLYKKLGFQECDSYYNPMEDVIYMKKNYNFELFIEDELLTYFLF